MITILGATGNVGGKIADILMKKGEEIRLVSRSTQSLKTRVGKKAHAYAGDLRDTEFLIKVFQGSDAVFSMIPPNLKAENFLGYLNAIGESIAHALEVAKIKYVVNLSSIGADLAVGTGPIVALHNQEERLNAVKGLNVLHLRAGYFMENELMTAELIRAKGMNAAAIKGDIKIPMIATKDIAGYAAERLVKRDFSGSLFADLLGPRDISLIEATAIIGRKIRKPDLGYVTLPYEEAEKALITAGLSGDVAKKYIEMQKGINDGRIIANLERRKEISTPTTFEVFCDEVFVPLYHRKKAA